MLTRFVSYRSGAEVLDVYNVNLFAPLGLVQAVLLHMRAQKQGVIANIAGIGALAGAAGAGVFCSTKAALTTVTEALHTETAQANITATLIQLGRFRTRFLNPAHRRKAAAEIATYHGIMDPVRKTVDDLDDKQPGNPQEAGRLIVEVLSGSGRAKGRSPPGYFAVGSDVPEAFAAAQLSTERNTNGRMEGYCR